MTDFFDLTDTDMQDYIRESRGFQGMWFFHHVPKTAGSSLVAELSDEAAPYVNVAVDNSVPGPGFAQKRDAAAAGFVAGLAHHVPRSASGHLLARHVDAIAKAQPDARFFTFLRHPVARVVSEYNYSCSPLHPPHQSFVQRYPTLESFALDPAERNKCAQYLLDDPDLPWADILTRLRSRYHLLGVQERYPVSFLLMSGMIFNMRLPSKKERVGAARDPLDPALAKLIREANEVDLAMHDAVMAVYERIALAVWTLNRDGVFAA